jgi:hypothetical protein
LEICHFSAASVLMMVADEMADAGNSNSNKTGQNDIFHLLPFTFYSTSTDYTSTMALSIDSFIPNEMLGERTEVISMLSTIGLAYYIENSKNIKISKEDLSAYYGTSLKNHHHRCNTELQIEVKN